MIGAGAGGTAAVAAMLSPPPHPPRRGGIPHAGAAPFRAATAAGAILPAAAGSRMQERESGRGRAAECLVHGGRAVPIPTRGSAVTRCAGAGRGGTLAAQVRRLRDAV